MKIDAPWLHTNNRFSCLSVYDIVDSNDDSVPPSPSSSKVVSSISKRPKWESRLPKQYVLDITLATDRNHLLIRVSVETLDSGVSDTFSALVDCGATGEFID